MYTIHITTKFPVHMTRFDLCTCQVLGVPTSYPHTNTQNPDYRQLVETSKSNCIMRTGTID